MDSSCKEWYVIIEDKQLGPFSLFDLKNDYRFTPDTLVWKKDFKEWIKARYVPEMKELFKDQWMAPQSLHEKGKESGSETELGVESQATLTLQQDPYNFILWILLILLIFFYSFYQFYYQF